MAEVITDDIPEVYWFIGGIGLLVGLVYWGNWFIEVIRVTVRV